jgi:hypothetical protein
MRYCAIRKELSSLYFGLDVFSQSGARVLEFDQCTVYTVQGVGGRGCLSNYGTLASNRQNTANLKKYNDDIFLLILQFLISEHCECIFKSYF